MHYTFRDLKMMLRAPKNKKRFIPDDYEMFLWKYDLTRRQAIDWCNENENADDLREYIKQCRADGAVTFGVELDTSIPPHSVDNHHWRFWGYDEDSNRIESAYRNVVYMKEYAFPSYWDAFADGLRDFIEGFAKSVEGAGVTEKTNALAR